MTIKRILKIIEKDIFIFKNHFYYDSMNARDCSKLTINKKIGEV